MRVNWNYIKAIILLGFVVFLYAFSSSRNNTRIVSKPLIKFIGNNNNFISEENVSKLLIQNEVTASSVRKEILDLNELENVLNENPMVKNAEVYLSVNGLLTAKVEQRQPIARVRTTENFYIDEDGLLMPLSKNKTERVPIINGFVDKKDLKNVYTIAKFIWNDDFLKKHVVEINQNKNNTVYLKLRQYNFKVFLGQAKQLTKKTNNLKAFYKKALKDKKLDEYSLVNLQFDNQVVCTKI